MSNGTTSILVDGIKHECGLRYDIVVTKQTVEVACFVEDYITLFEMMFWTEDTGDIENRDFGSLINNNTCLYRGPIEMHTVSLNSDINLIKCTTRQVYTHHTCHVAIIKGCRIMYFCSFHSIYVN